jgi:plasmid stabilization system protein ParE
VDYRLLFTQRALSDLSEIVGHIAQDDDEAASRFGKALLDHVDLLGRFPRMGNTTRKKSRVRKLVP